MIHEARVSLNGSHFILLSPSYLFLCKDDAKWKNFLEKVFNLPNIELKKRKKERRKKLFLCLIQ
jgi:hypothetical protein